MKRCVLALLTMLVATAQTQRRDFTKEDDQQAIAFYRETLRNQPDAGLFLNTKKEALTCGLVVSYEQMDWLEDFSATRESTLGKLGITPASVNILKTSVARKLVLDLANRIKDNRPLKEPCPYCICNNGTCATYGIDLLKIYQVGDFLESIVKDTPAAGEDVSLADIHETWKKSVIQESSTLSTKCWADMKNDPNEWSEYSWECETLIKALSYGVDPSSMKLTKIMTDKLRAVNKK